MRSLWIGLAIGMAGFVGSIARWLVSTFFGRMNIQFPIGTFVINITGSLFLGWFISQAAKHQFSATTRLAIGVGFVGAYTTFSTYMFESFRLLNDGAELKAFLNLFGSMAVGLLAVWIGVWLARWT